MLYNKNKIEIYCPLCNRQQRFQFYEASVNIMTDKFGTHSRAYWECTGCHGCLRYKDDKAVQSIVGLVKVLREQEWIVSGNKYKAGPLL